MSAVETPERLVEICHKRHGWIAAPDGFWFQRQGRSYWLCTNGDIEPGYHFPYGTRFNASSIIAEGEAIHDA